MGFIHTGKPLSFVYDIADVFKFDTVVPVAFQVAAKQRRDADREVRLRCRDVFRQSKLMKRIVPAIGEILAAGELDVPKPHTEAVPVAIPEKEHLGDAGHRG